MLGLRGVAGPHPFFGNNQSWVFLQNSFSIEYLMINKKVLNFSGMVGHPEGVAGSHYFFGKN